MIIARKVPKKLSEQYNKQQLLLTNKSTSQKSLSNKLLLSGNLPCNDAVFEDSQFFHLKNNYQG